MRSRLRNLADLLNDVDRNGSINGQQSRLPILRQNSIQVSDDVRATKNISRVVENGIAQQNNVIHAEKIPSQNQTDTRKKLIHFPGWC